MRTPAPILFPLTLDLRGTQEVLWGTGLTEGGLLVLKRSPLSTSDPFHLMLDLMGGLAVEAAAEVAEVFPEVGFRVRFTSIAPSHQTKVGLALRLAHSQITAISPFPPPPEQLIERGEKRSEMRISVAFEVQLETFKLIQRGKVCDVSYSGASVWVTKPFILGEQVQIVGPQKRFSLQAVVRNCVLQETHWRLGLQFTEPPKDWVIAP